MSKYDNEVVESSLSGGFTPAPAGNHIGVLVGVVLLGTIDTEFEGRVTRKKMLRLYFELSNTSNPEDEDKPFIVAKDYANTLGSKSNLRKLINGAWGPITDEQAEKLNLVKLLGCACMINVTVVTSQKSKNQYNDILNLSPIPDGVPMPVQKTEEFLFNFNLPFKEKEFNELEKFVQDKIKTSDEYQALVANAPVQQAAPAGNVPFATPGAQAQPAPQGAGAKRPFG